MFQAILLLPSLALSVVYAWHFCLDPTVTLNSPCPKPYFHFLHNCILFLTFLFLFYSYCSHDLTSTCLNHVNRLSSKRFLLPVFFQSILLTKHRFILLKHHFFLKLYPSFKKPSMISTCLYDKTLTMWLGIILVCFLISWSRFLF